MMIPVRVKVVKPLRICGWLLEVGDEFNITEWNETNFGTFFRPLNVRHMTAGMGWLFTTKTFNVIKWEHSDPHWDECDHKEQFYSDMGYGDEQYD